MTCEELPVPDNCAKNPTSWGYRVNYECDTGYAFIGPAKTKLVDCPCEWDPTLEISFYLNNDLFCLGIDILEVSIGNAIIASIKIIAIIC